MKSELPLVSICILCFNAESTIERALSSALAQDYKNFEIIIVDDCSTDCSPEIIKSLQKKKKFRLIVHKENTGPGGARDTAIKNAKGKFVVFFDDDDFSSSGRVRIQLETIQKFEKKLKTRDIACYASECRVYKNGYKAHSPAIGSRCLSPPHGPKVAKYILCNIKDKKYFYGAGTPTSALMIRTANIQNVGGFDPKFRRVEDLDLAVRLALNGFYFVGSKEFLLTRFMTLSEDKSEHVNLQFERKLAEKYKAFLLKEQLFYHSYHWPLLRFYHFEKKYFRFFLKLINLSFRNPIRTFLHILDTGPKRLYHENKIKT
ncbi:glycosyl transferase [SAR116 cluster alpha proteobacterium HIMB100]|nr:glycosyl transferase [SAR116 cluster alpha proteobacterium HIMB100]